MPLLKPIEDRDPYAAAVLEAFDRLGETKKPKCSTCDGSGWLPPIGGKKGDGGRRCHECNKPVCKCGGLCDSGEPCPAANW